MNNDSSVKNGWERKHRQKNVANDTDTRNGKKIYCLFSLHSSDQFNAAVATSANAKTRIEPTDDDAGVAADLSGHLLVPHKHLLAGQLA